MSEKAPTNQNGGGGRDERTAQSAKPSSSSTTSSSSSSTGSESSGSESPSEHRVDDYEGGRRSRKKRRRAKSADVAGEANTQLSYPDGGRTAVGIAVVAGPGRTASVVEGDTHNEGGSDSRNTAYDLLHNVRAAMSLNAMVNQDELRRRQQRQGRLQIEEVLECRRRQSRRSSLKNDEKTRSKMKLLQDSESKLRQQNSALRRENQAFRDAIELLVPGRVAMRAVEHGQSVQFDAAPAPAIADQGATLPSSSRIGGQKKTTPSQQQPQPQPQPQSEQQQQQQQQQQQHQELDQTLRLLIMTILSNLIQSMVVQELQRLYACPTFLEDSIQLVLMLIQQTLRNQSRAETTPTSSSRSSSVYGAAQTNERPNLLGVLSTVFNGANTQQQSPDLQQQEQSIYPLENIFTNTTAPSRVETNPSIVSLPPSSSGVGNQSWTQMTTILQHVHPPLEQNMIRETKHSNTQQQHFNPTISPTTQPGSGGTSTGGMVNRPNSQNADMAHLSALASSSAAIAHAYNVGPVMSPHHHHQQQQNQPQLHPPQQSAQDPQPLLQALEPFFSQPTSETEATAATTTTTATTTATAAPGVSCSATTTTSEPSDAKACHETTRPGWQGET